ncbi:protein-L-isoaspartate(D-aspartate) O-methyltransferase [Acetobacteroides hydrogenigenes]|uniref:Protein-L-isoaspartate O-methyltransferase n=1 Tax=Acetobacteroides hydrogenigenes TaxID=979970 RepID=A0A4R2EWC4_9BACT|nr:protein-L-isoaspartate(D-aspartate) O-methyltransferase [Acetobacteroides hydrogenigenes]TCN72996.1 protein-L-isoaspartate(D-aspartate) O-methyltransferase [Acetobacteroides hydrogenigenes]
MGITIFEDSYRHKGLRRKLIEELRRKGIRDERVLNAFDKVPRHLFMDSSFVEFAYQDKAFPIAAGQTISQPYTVAFMTELLNIKPLDKVFEVGTGSGYQTAILSELGAKVYTIERQKDLFQSCQHLLKMLGYNPLYFFGDGYLGKPSYAPYDKIIVTAGAPEIPKDLIAQLAIGGRMVIPIGTSDLQVMTTLDRISPTQVDIHEHGNFVFVPMLKGTNNR